MKVQHCRAWCDCCGRWVRAERRMFDHLTNLLGCAFTCGLWLPLWVLSALDHGPPYRCPECGLRLKPRMSVARAFNIAVTVVFLALAALVAAAMTFGPRSGPWR